MLNNLKWYVLIHDFNKDEIKNFNIFDSGKFIRGINIALKDYDSYGKFKEDVRGALFYAFCSKAEYEIICKGLVSKEDNEFKIDVYKQVLPNLDILARYIITEANKNERKEFLI